jgi:hypothetical protein
MIDATLFARWIRVFGERIGKPLSTDTSAAYYATLSAELTTADFDTAMQRIFRDHIYATWPSPKAIIETVRPTTALEGAAAWNAIANVIRLRPGESKPHEIRNWIVRDAGESAANAFEAIGGVRRYLTANDWRLDEMRSEFMDRSSEIGRLSGNNGHGYLPPTTQRYLGTGEPE